VFINTNVSALQSVDNLYNTTQSMDNVLQQLSSGYQINSAADNPAGLAISQEMQTQITGLNQAAQNAQAGISLLQTADGAMNNIDTILQSMRSLASQAATGTNNPTDLQALQQEMNQYAQEITNIANTTQFNNLNLLSGAFGGATGGYYNSQGQYVGGTQTPLQNIQIGANQGQQISLGINPMDAYSLDVVGLNVGAITGNTFTGSLSSSESTTQGYLTNAGNGLFTPSSGSTYSQYNIAMTTPTVAGLATGSSSDIGQTAAALTASTTAGAGVLSGTFTGTQNTSYTINVTGVSSTQITYSVTGSDGYSATGLTAAYTSGSSSNLSFTDGASTLSVGTGTSAVTAGESATFSLTPAQATLGLYKGTSQASTVGSTTTLYGSELGANASATLGDSSSSDQVTLNNVGGLIGSTTYSALTTLGSTAPTAAQVNFQVSAAGSAAVVQGNGVVTTNATAASGINISTQGNASSALTVIDQALTAVNAQRAVIGAYQNELQFAVSNAQTGSTNLSSAQAGILDTNMALQMANLSKYQILQQTGVAMLSQANAMPQALLKLIG
jgi:flagellin